MAEAPALTIGQPREFSVAFSEESIPTLTTIGNIVRNSVLPRAEETVQEAPTHRATYVIGTDKGNIRINVPADRLEGPVVVYYPTKVGKGKDMRDARVALTLANGYEFTSLSDRQSKHPVHYEAPQDELIWLSDVLTHGEIKPVETTVAIKDEVVEVDASPIGK